MHTIAILNPTAGTGRAGKQYAAVETALQTVGWDVELWVTEAAGQAVALAQQAASVADIVLAVGGDGTIHEVSQGLIASAHTAHLGVLPLGTGNDFVKMLGLASDPSEAVAQLLRATPTAVDYGLVRWGEGAATQERMFINAVGIGLDAQVAIEVERFKWMPGRIGYVAAALWTLRRWKAPHVRIEAVSTGATPTSILYEGRLLLVTAGNGVSSGGTFYLTPRASITDCLLDVCIIKEAPFRRRLRVMPLVLQGVHEEEPEVQMERVQGLRIVAEAGMPVHADGEMLSVCARTIAIEVVPQGLSVLMPG